MSYVIISDANISRDRVLVLLLFNPFRPVTDGLGHFNVSVSQA